MTETPRDTETPNADPPEGQDDSYTGRIASLTKENAALKATVEELAVLMKERDRIDYMPHPERSMEEVESLRKKWSEALARLATKPEEKE